MEVFSGYGDPSQHGATLSASLLPEVRTAQSGRGEWRGLHKAFSNYKKKSHLKITQNSGDLKPDQNNINISKSVL